MPKRLVYLLDCNFKNEVTCTTVTTTVMKREAFSSALLGDIKTVLQPSVQIKLDALDRKIVMGLAMRSTRRNETVVLSGLDSFELLRTIIKTRHAFWARSKEPALSLGDDVPGGLIWLDQEEGTVRPHCQTAGGSARALATTPPAYFDPTANQIGGLSLKGPASAFARWISAQPMTLEAAHKWFLKLKQDYPEAPVPSPPEMDMDSFKGQPRATLTIQQRTSVFKESAAETKLLPLSQTVGLELSFAYGAATFKWDDEREKTAVHQGGKVVSIQRDAVFENEIVERLAAIGILPEASASSFGLLALNSRKFLFPQELDKTFDQYLKNDFLRFTQTYNVDLIDAIRLLEEDFTSGIEIELKSNPDATFKLSAQDPQSKQPVDLVQLLQIYLKTLPEMPLEQLLRQVGKQTFTLVENDTRRPIAIPGSQVAPLLSTLVEIVARSDSAGARPDHIPLRQAVQLAMQNHENDSGHYEDIVPRALVEYIMAWNRQPVPEATTSEKPAVPASGFKATLRAYQATGVAWLSRVISSGYGAILADEMGLGKTVQTLALIISQTGATKPSLLVAPSSLLSTWLDEAKKFTPSLKACVQHGKDRETESTVLAAYDLVITSYALLHRDAEMYSNMDWNGIVLDEAHFIKNNRTKTYQAIEQMTSEWRLCLTGTPVENRLSDLFSLFQFIVPGYLGRVSDWRSATDKSTPNALSDDAMAQLKKEIAPFILRRTKEEVLTELPPKTEALAPVELRAEEREAYDIILAAADKTIRDEIERRGFAQSSITILNCLMRLRQCCCDPELIDSFAEKEVHKTAGNAHSTKTEYLLRWLPELLAEDHKVLIFSSFAQYLKKLSQAFEEAGHNHSLLIGSTVDRDKEIRKFRQGENSIFLLSLKAGGVGLTLTEADTVIHCDPWWNPAAEEQASARIHRIGQQKPVFIYKLVAEGTIESRILEMQEEKRALADRLLSQDQEAWSLDPATLEELLGK